MKDKWKLNPLLRIVALFLVLIILFIGAGIGLFYILFSIPEPEGLSLATWPNRFTDNFSIWMKNDEGTLQIENIGLERLDEYGIPYQSPAGGHGIFLDAAKFYPQIPYNEFPGQVLSIELYKECGLRGCDIGSFMIGNDPDTGKQLKSINEFTRLAIPRRVYTQTHYDMVIEAINEVWKKRETIKRGYRITWEPPILRHFQATLEPIE